MTESLPLDQQNELIADLDDGRRDRTGPDEFTGRNEELLWLERSLRAVLRDGKGLTTVVEGVPGIGKTSLVMRFLGHATERGAVPVVVDASDLRHPMNLAIRMARAVLRVGPKEGEEAIRETLGIPRGFNVSATVLGTGLSFGRGGGKEPAFKRDPYAEGMPTMVALEMMGIPEDVPFVVFVDEAHRLPEKAKDVVAAFHSSASDRRVLPVYAGMPWRTREIVESLCSRRLADDSARRLGTMEDVEVRTSIWRTCRKIGIQAPALDKLAKDLTVGCGGFPRHIASALGGVASVERRLRMEKRTTRLDDVPKCVENASARRDRFYRSRLATAFESPDLKEEPPMDLFAVFRAPPGTPASRRT